MTLYTLAAPTLPTLPTVEIDAFNPFAAARAYATTHSVPDGAEVVVSLQGVEEARFVVRHTIALHRVLPPEKRQLVAHKGQTDLFGAIP